MAASGIISVVAGEVNNNGGGYYGDGGPAAGAGLNFPWGIAIDSGGNLYIADTNNGRIRIVSAKGIISTVAGGGSNRAPGGPATQFSLVFYTPVAVVADAIGNIFIGCNAENGAVPTDGDEIFKVTPDDDRSRPLRRYEAERPASQNLGDGGPATRVRLSRSAGWLSTG